MDRMKPSPAQRPPQAPTSKPRAQRHVVILGDVLLEAYSSIDQTPGEFEDALLPGTRDQWKVSFVSAAEVARAGAAAVLPADATHAVIFIEGNHAIEQSGLLAADGLTGARTLELLSLAPDEFERTLGRLIHAAQSAKVANVVCTMYPPRYKAALRQRIARAALAIFNDRVIQRAAAARVALADLGLICTEDEDYDLPTRLSKSGVQKLCNVIRYVLFELEEGLRRSEIFY